MGRRGTPHCIPGLHPSCSLCVERPHQKEGLLSTCLVLRGSPTLQPLRPPAEGRVFWKLLEVMLASQVRLMGRQPLAGAFPDLCYGKLTGWSWCGRARLAGDGHWAGGKWLA